MMLIEKSFLKQTLFNFHSLSRVEPVKQIVNQNLRSQGCKGVIVAHFTVT